MREGKNLTETKTTAQENALSSELSQPSPGGGDNTIFDDVFRTMIERVPELLLPVINEVFGTDYGYDEPIVRHQNEFHSKSGETISDSHFDIRNYTYHVECESRYKATIYIRMIEYDFNEALENERPMDGGWEMDFPRSCVIYLTHTESTPDVLRVKVNLPNGESFTYEAPTIKVQEYTGDEIFQKKLLFFIPYYLMRYKKQLEDENCDVAELDEIAAEFGEILNRLDSNLVGEDKDEVGYDGDGRKCQREKEYECLVKLTERIAKYVTRKSGEARERIGGVMGGKVLDLDCEEVKELKKERRNTIIKMVQSGIPEKDILFCTDCDMGELEEIRQQMEG